MSTAANKTEDLLLRTFAVLMVEEDMDSIHRMTDGSCPKHGNQDRMPMYRECLACVGEFLVKHPQAMLQFAPWVGVFKLQLVGYNGKLFHMAPAQPGNYTGVHQTAWLPAGPTKDINIKPVVAKKPEPTEISEWDLLPDAD